MHVDGSRLNVGRRLPHNFEQQIAGLDAAFPFGEQKKQFDLRRRQLVFSTIEGHRVLRAVDSQWPDLLDVFRFLASRLHAPQNCADPKNEFLGAERFREIIVGAQAETLDTIAFLAPGRQHQDCDARGGAVGAQFLHDLQSRQAGKHQIQNHYGRLVTSCNGEALGPARRR